MPAGKADTRALGPVPGLYCRQTDCPGLLLLNGGEHTHTHTHIKKKKSILNLECWSMKGLCDRLVRTEYSQWVGDYMDAYRI